MKDWGISVVAGPSGDVLTTAEAKKHLEIADAITAHDTAIDALVDAAVDWFERETDTRLLTQTVKLTIDGFPDGDDPIYLPIQPLQSVSSVTYDDTTADDNAFTAYVASTHTTPPRISLDSTQSVWPVTKDQADTVEITCVVGYGAGGDVPESIRQCLLMIVAHWFENREAVGVGSFNEMPIGVRMIVDKFRMGHGFHEVAS